MPTSNSSIPSAPASSSIRRIPLKRLVLASALLLTVVVLGFVSLNRVKGKAHGIMEVTLPDLSDAGMAKSDLAEDFDRTLLAVMATLPADAARYRKEAEHFADESKQYFDSYGRIVSAPGDRANYQNLLGEQKKYFMIRRKIFDLVDAAKKEEAVALCRESLLPAYKTYSGAAETLLFYNINRGEARGESILRFCRFTQYAVAGCVVALFVLGFIIGVFR